MARSFALVFNALALIVLLAGLQTCAASAALVNRAPQGSPSHTCQPGQNQCCETIGIREDGVIEGLLNKLGSVVDNILPRLNGIVGIYCIPIGINVPGAIDTQSACRGYPVCCSNVHLNGLVAAGCIPITVTV
ncbi:hypothetical protein DFP72DRAFT_1066574 [Ephemerocybe angulata]|uniref:Hydrophobin n=1 Tax=Ephemerocybe angulata TaxID=980116 RepID=A0A8H6I2G5_9AGAR|nr:hypothetical protein DFP72DRAFT_1066574 [Tulosesus angulatus]